MSLSGLIEWEGAVDDGPDLPRLEVRTELEREALR